MYPVLLLTVPWGVQAQGVRTFQGDQAICSLKCQLALAVTLGHSVEMKAPVRTAAVMTGDASRLCITTSPESSTLLMSKSMLVMNLSKP